MQKTILFYSVAASILLASCKKDEEEAPDTELPVIQLTSPTNNQVFAAGQTVTISGTITDNAKLGEVHLEIINLTTGGFVTHEHFVPNAPTYTLTKSFTVQGGTSYRIKVEAEDGKRNKAQADRQVSAN